MSVIVGQFQSFSVAGPQVWNQLLMSVRQMDHVMTFKRHQKISLFVEVYCASDYVLLLVTL